MIYSPLLSNAPNFGIFFNRIEVWDQRLSTSLDHTAKLFDQCEACVSCVARNFHVLDHIQILFELIFHAIEHCLVNINLHYFSINFSGNLFLERFSDSLLPIYHLLVEVDLLFPANRLLLFQIHNPLDIVITAIVGHLAVGVLLQIVWAILHHFGNSLIFFNVFLLPVEYVQQQNLRIAQILGSICELLF